MVTGKPVSQSCFFSFHDQPLGRRQLASKHPVLNGLLQRGDEQIGLVQAMLSTGVQMVAASLWKVPDDATRALFEASYTELVTGSSPASAMQEAAWLIRGKNRHDGQTFL